MVRTRPLKYGICLDMRCHMIASRRFGIYVYGSRWREKTRIDFLSIDVWIWCVQSKIEIYNAIQWTDWVVKAYKSIPIFWKLPDYVWVCFDVDHRVTWYGKVSSLISRASLFFVVSFFNYFSLKLSFNQFETCGRFTQNPDMATKTEVRYFSEFNAANI